MSLPWQTNWTHMMKTNATANRLLNTRIGDSTFFVTPAIATKPASLRVTLGELIGFDEKSNKPQFQNEETRTMSEKQFASAYNKLESMKNTTDNQLNDKDIGSVIITAVDINEGVEGRIKKSEEITSEDMDSILNNTYVKDYLNIHHPSIRVDLTSSLTNQPLQIKPPPVFFSS